MKKYLKKNLNLEKMINYLKYLTKNPLKVLWLLFVDAFCTTVLLYFIEDRDNITDDNSSIIYISIVIFIILIGIVANYQPYKEYKDGL